eukprot:TRINITY_DN4187_c0_g1::TRINITY_DN4187_c0_g1_i1::g.2042::m.2042 TRINITY_DN4187_c0_g1::TRINITY_DN4187_c0_g1_i1::g.2042  ORF type:complete len:266 (+),score=62.74,sp/Q38931/FKB62_ARATH/37.35/5e-25,TPR_11/PF13414.1/3.9e-11,TPR_11/PF13414.1/6.9e-11,TPR_11/PF13414.1/0.0004,TPR_1/PF00515.23/0.89,TPR_1/PF00515.23/0.00012,TPR_1/PF00515.23/8.3e-06,TPR_2/PF07719.12/0.26,TPR_2/PF07719.12/0.0051,TPR_2/PF07719.12/1.4e-05,TPR_12/PF13424.1/0.0086,TPR_12/PF13424.1/1.9e-06,TPR_12/PF13424.1/0.043,TPR_16/PF13432.1/2
MESSEDNMSESQMGVQGEVATPGQEDMNQPSGAEMQADEPKELGEKTVGEMSSQEKLEYCVKLKTEGNDHFKTSQFPEAIEKYKQAVIFIDYLMGHEKTFANAETDPIKLQCFLNTAACHYKLEDYKKGIEFCEKALVIDSASVKARFRRGQCYLRLERLEEAKADLQRALRGAPNDASILREMKELKEKEAEINEAQKELYRKMMSPAPAANDKKSSSKGSNSNEFSWLGYALAGVVAVGAIAAGVYFYTRPSTPPLEHMPRRS